MLWAQNGGAGGASRGRDGGRGPARIHSGNMTGGNMSGDVVCDGAAAGWGGCGVFVLADQELARAQCQAGCSSAPQDCSQH